MSEESSVVASSAFLSDFTVYSFFVSDLELEESDPPQADNDNAIDDASNNATIFFFICFSFHFICFKMFRLLLFSRVYLFNQISPPYKYFRIKRAVYLWLEILDESLLYFLKYHQVGDEINCVVIYSFVFPVFIPVTVDAFFQIFFCNIQIVCNFIFIFTTVFVGSDQTE